MCFVLTCVFYRRIKSRCVWLNVKQCTQSFTGRHNMYTASRQSSSAYGCNRPKIIRKSHCVGLFKWNLVQRLAVARKRKWENPPDSDQSVWSEPLIICCDDIFCYWELRQIFRGNKYQRRQAVIVSLPTWIGFTKSQRIWTITLSW
jgi:hypothetical protein